MTDPHFSDLLNDEAKFWAHDADIPCFIGGKPKTLASEPIFCEFWYCTGESKSVDFDGAPFWQTPGILQFTISASDAMKSRSVKARVKRLVDNISLQTWFVGNLHFIDTEEMDVVSLPELRKGRRITIVDGGFDLYEEAG